jgi:hypothetical protein
MSCFVGDVLLGVAEGPFFGSGVMAVDWALSLVSLAFGGVLVASANESVFVWTVFVVSFALDGIGTVVFS